jgi:hypothetical protein
MGGVMLAGAQNRMLETRFERGCAGKDRYPSETSADAALLMLKRGEICHPRNAGRWDTLQSYRCGECGEYHHGHP